MDKVDNLTSHPKRLWNELSLGDVVLLEGQHDSEFYVHKIQQVVGVDFDKGRWGSHLVNLDNLEAIPLPEPRVKLEIGLGSWYGYWYPNRQKFAVINNDSNWWETLVRIHDLPWVYYVEGKKSPYREFLK